ncbi:MAG: diguanylate cyclase, partial [Lachnospiraceae bacterium]|nr:diguanylate cyclase [Lachnospiraceae bacterium]
QWCATKVVSNSLFTIFTETMDREKIGEVCRLIEEVLPEANYFGCSTNGNIINGKLCSTPIGVTCTLFEYPSTKLEILQYHLTEETSHDVATSLIEEIDKRPWVSAVELLTTIRGMSMTGFCEDLSGIRKGVEVFGGGAFSEDMNENAALVFSKGNEMADNGVVFALIGGEDFYTNTRYIAGWKPLGRELQVTKAKGSILYELDGKPAYDTYYKYLHIKNDESFFYNTLEFPFFYHHNGIEILRAPTASNPDGSLSMTSDIEENVMTRMAYGDPWTILDVVRKGGKEIQGFFPEVINIFSCAARRTFWGNAEVSKESMPFQSIAPTSGFYTSSEFLRTNDYVNQHNVTLVIAAMREGDAYNKGDESFVMQEEGYSGKVSMINRLATFIAAATQELAEANQKLSDMAITDGLTQLFNRKEIQHRITRGTKGYMGKFPGTPISGLSLIMLDIDNFKKVNDTYGHKVGDDVLMGMSRMLKDTLQSLAETGFAGRWGGEEFMIMLPECGVERASEIAETFRKNFAAIDFDQAGAQTVSIGVTEFRKGEDSDTLCIRVDEALYKAKENGKNQVVVV